MESLLQLCREHEIAVEYDSLTRSGRVLGWFCRAWDGQPVILLDKRLLTQPRLHRCILAEEIGHYVTVPQGTLASSYVAPDIHHRRRDEHRAVRWAADRLIPYDELRRLMLRDERPMDKHVIEEYAEHFYVTTWLMWQKLQFMREDEQQFGKLLHVAKFRDLAMYLSRNRKFSLNLKGVRVS